MNFDAKDPGQTGPFITGFEPGSNIVSLFGLIKKALEIKSGNYLKNHLLQLMEASKKN